MCATPFDEICENQAEQEYVQPDENKQIVLSVALGIGLTFAFALGVLGWERHRNEQWCAGHGASVAAIDLPIKSEGSNVGELLMHACVDAQRPIK